MSIGTSRGRTDRARRRGSMLRILVLCAAWVAAQHAGAHHPAEPLPALDFVAPAAGTYPLHRIMPAPDGRVLDVRGRVQRLDRFTRGKITLLGFIYTTCIDPDGC